MMRAEHLLVVVVFASCATPGRPERGPDDDTDPEPTIVAPRPDARPAEAGAVARDTAPAPDRSTSGADGPGPTPSPPDAGGSLDGENDAGVLSGAPLAGRRPNILLVIADDLGWPNLGAYGDAMARTPTIDRLAREGVIFNHAFVSAPSCSPSRAALLTGRNFWELGQASTLWASFPRSLAVYPDLLARAGYRVGRAGKGWGPGTAEGGGNPAGPTRDFASFIADLPQGTPFCYWFGSLNPHRPYDTGAGRRSGRRTADVRAPPFLPDHETVRNDLLDYYEEIDRLDNEVRRLRDALDARGLLASTMIIVTSDNGMPFPRAKATVYDSGARVPLVVSWPGAVSGGRVVDDFVNLIDLAPTFLEAAGVSLPSTMSGRSLLPLLAAPRSGQVDPARDRVFVGVDRHAMARDGNKGYPVRAVRTRDYLYVRNYRPTLWPAGNPQGFADIDDSPSKSYLLGQRTAETVKDKFGLACRNRPAEELYDLKKDPHQLYNVAGVASYDEPRKILAQSLASHLAETKDPVAAGRPDVMDRYPWTGSGQPPPAVPPEPPFVLATPSLEPAP